MRYMLFLLPFFLTSCMQDNTLIPAFTNIDYVYEYQEQKAPHDDRTCRRESCPLVRGRLPDVITDEPLKIWMNVLVSGDKEVDIGRTYQESTIYYFFEGASDFSKAFGFDPKSKELGVKWYRIARFSDMKTQCIFPSPDRDLPAQDQEWICLEKA